MKEYKCNNCGATINPATGVCPYCRSRYELNNDNVIRIEAYHNPIKVYKSTISVPDSIIKTNNSNTFSNHIIHELAQNMTNAIAENLEIETGFDPETMSQRFTARVRIVEPKYLF